MDDYNDSGAFDQEEYEADQAARPPHKRDGYAELIAEIADDMRKMMRENAE